MTARRSPATAEQLATPQVVPAPKKRKTKRRQPPQEPRDLSPAIVALPGRLRQARDELEIGSVELDAMAGLAQGVTSRIESGKRKQPNVETIYRLAKAMGVNVHWLVTGEGQMLLEQRRPVRSAD